MVVATINVQETIQELKFGRLKVEDLSKEAINACNMECSELMKRNGLGDMKKAEEIFGLLLPKKSRDILSGARAVPHFGNVLLPDDDW